MSSDLTIGQNFNLDTDYGFLLQAIQETFDNALGKANQSLVGNLIAQTISSPIGVSLLSHYYDFDGLKEFTGTTRYSEFLNRLKMINAKEWSNAFKHSFLDVRRDPMCMTRSSMVLAGQLARHKESIIFSHGVRGGFSGVHIDDQPFFSASHYTHNASGTQVTYSNYDSGTDPLWLLVDCSDTTTLPFAYQLTEAPNVISVTDPNDSVVRSHQYFEVIGRCSDNATQVFHQKVIASREALTFDNLSDAFERMASQCDSNGDSQGIQATNLIVGPKLTKSVRAMVKDTAVLGSPIINLGDMNNFVTVMQTPYLNF